MAERIRVTSFMVDDHRVPMAPGILAVPGLSPSLFAARLPGGSSLQINRDVCGEKVGGVLPSLNGWCRDPFAHRPDVIAQASRHRGGPLLPSSFVVALA